MQIKKSNEETVTPKILLKFLIHKHDLSSSYTILGKITCFCGKR